MRRVLIFVLVGPPVGLAVGVLFLLPAFSFMAGDPMPSALDQIMRLFALLPLAYLLGFVPALLVCFADAILESKGFGWRIMWITFVGFFAGFLPLLSSLPAGLSHEPLLTALLGFVGAVPAAMCSYLAGRVTRRQKQPGG